MNAALRQNQTDPAEFAWPGIDERKFFEAFVYANGKPQTAKRMAEHLGADGDCWSHAWAEAIRLDGHYVEGTVVLNGGAVRVRAHAWVELDTPTGTLVVECTDGYQESTAYLGVRVSTKGEAALATAAWPVDDRFSVIEAAIVAGLSPERTKEFIA